MGIESISFPDEYSPEKRAQEFFLKVYTWQDLVSDDPYCDDTRLSRDVEEAIALDNSKFMKLTDADDEGKFQGMIRVTLEYVP